MTSFGLSTSIELYRENICMFRFLPLCLYRGIKQNMAKPLLKKLAGFIEGEASLADKRSKRSPGTNLAKIPVTYMAG